MQGNILATRWYKVWVAIALEKWVVAILAWKSDDDADDDYDDDRKSDPYMSPSYAGDTKKAMIS